MKRAKFFEVIKKAVIVDLAVGMVITVVMWNALGMEGMAAEFCNLTKAEMCNEYEWSGNEGE